MKKDCIDCPITSPFGIIKALPNDTFVMHQDSVIVWNRQIRDLASEFQICNLTLHKLKKTLTALLFKFKIKIGPTFTT
jgi:hypothetical protein